MNTYIKYDHFQRVMTYNVRFPSILISKLFYLMHHIGKNQFQIDICTPIDLENRLENFCFACDLVIM